MSTETAVSQTGTESRDGEIRETPPSEYKLYSAAHVKPGDLLFEENVRMDAAPDEDLIESVRDAGVLELINVFLTDDQRLRVFMGERRARAAIAAETPLVTVYIRARASSEAADQIRRLIGQRAENTYRKGHTAADEVNFVEQMTLFGVTPEDIAAKSRMGRHQVDAALAVLRSKRGKAAAKNSPELDLVTLAALAEFEDDPDTYAALTEAAGQGTFEHRLERARSKRATAAAIAEATAAAEAAGLRIVGNPGWEAKAIRRLDSLRDRDNNPLTPENHADCLGHCAWIEDTWLPAEDGTGTRQRGYGPVYACDGWREHGHRDPGAKQQPAAALSPEELASSRAARQLVRENNAAWEPATTVRRRYLAKLAGAQKPPSGTARFIALAVTLDTDVFRAYASGDLAASLLGMKNDGGRKAAVPPKSATSDRCRVHALIHVLAACEASMTRDTWRRDNSGSSVSRYLEFLQSTGYELAPVEEFAASSQVA
jgi:ParB family chromosome partitioning protein